MSIPYIPNLTKNKQMENYYERRPGRSFATSTTPEIEDSENGNPILSEYDQYRQSLVNEDDDEGWNSEYQHYLKDRPPNVKKDTDIVQWWQVCPISFKNLGLTLLILLFKEHAQL